MRQAVVARRWLAVLGQRRNRKVCMKGWECASFTNLRCSVQQLHLFVCGHVSGDGPLRTAGVIFLCGRGSGDGPLLRP